MFCQECCLEETLDKSVNCPLHVMFKQRIFNLLKLKRQHLNITEHVSQNISLLRRSPEEEA